ncbi:global cell cycle regulator GcrA-like protein [Rhodothalassium salexigens]|uniref:GcrA family cell cycle regulator n=1 Tax=Rhodothalassium salexigens TaxID=1086 RepID=UPI0019138705|nr:GcrA family cell cycle regulator [Rhodothalassium salexigens]MBK5910249.1 global cell cycle regulator GcrA-like protein [Rhodothalassium salexigens]
MSWTDERIETLKRLWDAGKSASQIAAELGEGVTRNAVIGKAHRLGLKSRPSPVKSDAQASAKTGGTAAPAKKRTRKKKPADDRVTLLDLTERMCKWPYGHPGDADFHFCGKPSQPGLPYCAQHCQEAYQALQPRKDRRNRPPRII